MGAKRYDVEHVYQFREVNNREHIFRFQVFWEINSATAVYSQETFVCECGTQWAEDTAGEEKPDRKLKGLMSFIFFTPQKYFCEKPFRIPEFWYFWYP